MLQMKSVGEFSYLGEVRDFFLFKTSTDWMRPTHLTEDNLLYSTSTDLMIISSKHARAETLSLVFDQISGYPMAQSN